MAKKLQILRGTTAQNDAYTGSIGELTMDTEKVEVRIHDGITQGGKKIGSGGANLPILTHVFSDHIINDVSWLRADTFSWHSGDVYKAAYEHLLADFEGTISETETIGDITITYYLADDGHKICLPDQESNLVALYEATGVAWYYILDTENKQFKLPRTKWGFTGLRDSVGGYVAPGLPNITGGTGATAANATPYGAFRRGQSALTIGGGSGTLYQDNFNASWSNPIYGASDTVQPKATQMYLYFYVGNFEQTAVEQTAGITAETLNQKADIDGGNCSANFAKFGMPSDTYTDLTLGSSGSKYTAPADGWFAVNKVSSGTNQYAKLSVGDNKIVIEVRGPTNGTLCACYVPVKAGDVVTCTYTAAGATNFFRFIYAEGAKHLA